MGLRVKGGPGCLTQRRKGAKKKGKEEGREGRERDLASYGIIGKKVNWDGYKCIEIFLFTRQFLYTLPSFPHPLLHTFA